VLWRESVRLRSATRNIRFAFESPPIFLHPALPSLLFLNSKTIQKSLTAGGKARLTF
jgi:hypothetical protein